MLEDVLKAYKQAGGKDALLEAVKSYYGVKKLEKTVVSYILGEVELQGMFNIAPFEETWNSRQTFDEVFGRFGNVVFPGIVIGGDGSGVEFRLMLANGNIISLRRGAVFREAAADIPAETPLEFTRKFSSEGSSFTLESLLALQAASRTLSTDGLDFPVRFARTVAECLGWRLSKLNNHIFDNSLEFIFAPLDEFIEENGLEELVNAEKKLRKLKKVARTKKAEALDLSYCFLSTIPKELNQLPGLKELSLAGNLLAIEGAELRHLEILEKLVLTDCDAPVLPELPDSLQHLDIAGNEIEDITPLERLEFLKYVNLSGNPLKDEVVEEFKLKYPNCFVTMDSRRADFSSLRLDLSGRNLKKLPDNIMKYTQLEELNLSGNPRLNFVTVFNILSRFPHLKILNLEACALQKLPEELTRLKGLEEIYLGYKPFFHNYNIKNELNIADAMGILARLTKLTRFDITGIDGDLDQFILHLSRFRNIVSLTPVFGVDFGDNEVLDAFFEILCQLPHLEELVLMEISLENLNLHGLTWLKNLKTLKWKDQEYRREFPKEICSLDNLEVLEITDSDIEAIPPEIGKLKKLKHFVFSGKGGGIVDLSIPGAIGQLSNLESLTFSMLHVEKLPPTIGNLNKLKKLDLRENNILQELPEEIGQLGHLKELIVYRNTLNELPESIGNLGRLEVLDISDNNRLSHLPESIGNLGRLRDFQFHSCDRLETLPASFSKLENLRELQIYNQGLDYDDALQKIILLPRLEKLEMTRFNTDPFRLPENFHRLKSLKWLEVFVGDMDMEHEFKVISRLENLEHLELIYNKFSQLPEEFCGLKNLTSIRLVLENIDPSGYESVFSTLSRLPELKHINCHKSGIYVIPSEFGLLQNVESIDLSNNEVKEFPKELYELMQLRELNLRWTSIPRSKVKKLREQLPYTVIYR